MTEPREMTKEDVEASLADVRRVGASVAAHDLGAHIAALEARAERAEKDAAETREMHSQLARVCMQHQRDRDNARDAALEEAERRMDGLAKDCEGHSPISEAAFSSAADACRALKAQPARRFVEATHIQDVLAQVSMDAFMGRIPGDRLSLFLEVAKRLGVQS